VGERREFRGISGVGFSARIQRVEEEGAIVEVSGQGHYSGESRLVFERGDQLVNGFSIFDLTRPV
jgi:hypothetical protein